MQDHPGDGRRARGDASRRAVLQAATDLASVHGLDGLTIGRLASASGFSKSSVATLFNGKEGLQLATVAAARDIFFARIVAPARSESHRARRLAALLRNALLYSRNRVFTGGCFFAAVSADVDSKSGPVNEAVRAAITDWYRYVEAQAEQAVAAGELGSERPRTLAFELIALTEQANSRSLLLRTPEPYDIAAEAIRDRLRLARADDRALAMLHLAAPA
ncbi:TetR family transcriptional regulator [Leucobacter allii]|uniref:TetR family transcriptional regulator n=1 Tax=Leucobacter allii TaxID=2932247 RepID=A0ABY4FL59_9MICO|nr:TetR family transcriptional regulator [Leucobacter allii]UOQ57005.1 TetR family transcriptional regulator [Leucobacter allii]